MTEQELKTPHEQNHRVPRTTVGARVRFDRPRLAKRELDAKQLERLRSAWSEGVCERDLAARFAVPCHQVKAAVKDLRR